MPTLILHVDKELSESLNTILLKCNGKFASKSHLLRQLIVRGIDDYYEKDKTFDKFIAEVFNPNQEKKMKELR